MIDIEVKILSDRKVKIPYKRFGGTQGDTGYRVKLDISDIYNASNSYRVEWYGAADSFTQTIELEVSDGIIYADVPTEISKAGGTAVAYLVEEKVTDDKVTERICTYPIRLYFNNKPTGDNSVTVGEYERKVTDMYLAVVKAKLEIDEQAGEAQKSYNDAQAIYEGLAENIDKVNELEKFPRNIKVWLDTESYDKPTVMISCDVLDKFLDPTVAENDAYRLPIEVSKDRIGNHTVYLNSNLSAEFLWSLSEIKYSDSIAVCCYQIELTGAGEPIPIIRHFYPYSNESMLEQYILPLEAKIDSKKDMFHIAETSSLIDEADEYGNNFLDVKIDSGSENSTLQKDENGWIAVNTDVIANKDYVNSLVSGAVKRKVVEQLPTENIDLNTIYMVLADVVAENNIYNEFMYINEKWEQIGSTAVDLSGYATLDDFETKENKLVGGNAITISEVENAGEKRTVVSVYGVVMQGQYNADMAKKADKPLIEDIIPSVLVSNSEYYLGDVSTDTSLSFPSIASQGDTIYVNFNCTSEFTLAISGTNISDIDIDIEIGKCYEIFATFNGSIWILGYNEYTVS